MLMFFVFLSAGVIDIPQQSPNQEQSQRPAASSTEATVLEGVDVNRERAGEDPNRQICRRQAAAVGSNRSRRVCAPAWQWEQARQDTREALLRNSSGAGSRGSATLGGDAPPGRGF